MKRVNICARREKRVRRKTFWWSSLIILGFLAVVLGGAYLLLSHEPTFYQKAAVVPGPERASSSRAFEVKAFDLINEMQTRAHWQLRVTEQECNSWFAEDFIHSNLAHQLPANVREPRIAFVPGGVQ